MALILDARGNPFVGSIDIIGGETITDARTASATLGALNAELVMDIQGKAVASFEIRTAAMNATLVFEATLDGTNYFTVTAVTEATEVMTQAVVITTTNAQKYNVSATGWRRVRCRVSAYTSGNCVVTGRATVANFAIYTRPLPTTTMVTATATNATNTATLPAAGAGLFHYITSIQCVRATSAAVTGSAVLTITSTNLPGNPAWTCGNALAIGAQVVDLDLNFAVPLKSSVANTATTIVMPAAGVSVVERINVAYYVGA